MFDTFRYIGDDPLGAFWVLAAVGVGVSVIVIAVVIVCVAVAAATIAGPGIAVVTFSIAAATIAGPGIAVVTFSIVIVGITVISSVAVPVIVGLEKLRQRKYKKFKL